MNKNISFKEWYNRFQELIVYWKELSSDKNWIETHKDELLKYNLTHKQFRPN